MYKMIYSLSILIIAAVATSGADKPTLVLAPKLAALMSEKARFCQVESGADPSVLKKLLPWKMEETELNGKFLFCLLREVNFMDDNTRLDEEKFLNVFEESLESQDTDEIKSIIAECNQESGINRYFTIFKISNCFHAKTPFTMSLN